MKNRKASDFASGRELRRFLGLQFFAEDAADMDAAEDDGFAAGLFEDDDLESQQAADEQDGGDAANEPESQRDESQTEEAETQQAPEAEAPLDGTAEQSPAPVMTQLVVNGRQMAVPAEALRTIGQALGMDARELLERGMNYENRGAREISILDRYAQAGGYASRAAYLEEMERSLTQFRVDNALAELAQQYPETPEDALRPIAERTVNSQLEDERSQADARAREQAQEAMRRKGEELSRPYLEFIRAYPNVDPKTLDRSFFELVNSGLHPQAAYERQQTEKVRQEAEGLRQQLRANEKNQQNRQRTPGSMAGEALDADPFLTGFNEE